MNNEIKMIALDLDGTLLTSDKTISDYTQQVLKNLHSAGIKVVLCTGRPINAIWRFIEQLDLVGSEDYTITFNGALVVENDNKTELFKQGLKKHDFDRLHRFAKQVHAPLDLLDFEQAYSLTDLKPSNYQNQFKPGVLHFEAENYANISDQDEFPKAVMCDSPSLLDEYLAQLPAEANKHYHIVRSQPIITEFLAMDMDKQVGLSHLLNHFGWDFSNLMTFGDAENDLGMIKAAGTGVVMKNGQPQMLEIADVVTDFDNDHDGVAHYLETAFG
ncbi:Cof-type HAD-IIB family hydrolase [Lentilactobacillus senioris]|uniref:Cof-type HAD-IIB family hydrolase n=1 Tax=Lentilactobacillus senioris TaxID=931534 RepID=UPI002282E037|nr:Cof-type HAD-IIB family hydrolase [Lentilactobacillus senioris]MCY9806300.1 Cof-type HAD-IIB family hydrolase [Lentilactobacillus senioris]